MLGGAFYGGPQLRIIVRPPIVALAQSTDYSRRLVGAEMQQVVGASDLAHGRRICGDAMGNRSGKCFVRSRRYVPFATEIGAYIGGNVRQKFAKLARCRINQLLRKSPFKTVPDFVRKAATSAAQPVENFRF